MDLPQFSPRLRIVKKFRFVSSTNQINVGMTVNQLINICGCVATTATTASAIASAIKIESLELWAVPDAVAVASTVSVTWSAYGEVGIPKEESDTAISLSRPAHLRSAPPIDSLASFWHVEPTVSQDLFTFYLPVGGVMDLTISFLIKDTEVNSPVAGSLLNPGSMYYKNPVTTLTHVSLQSF